MPHIYFRESLSDTYFEQTLLWVHKEELYRVEGEAIAREQQRIPMRVSFDKYYYHRLEARGHGIVGCAY